MVKIVTILGKLVDLEKLQNPKLRSVASSRQFLFNYGDSGSTFNTHNGEHSDSRGGGGGGSYTDRINEHTDGPKHTDYTRDVEEYSERSGHTDYRAHRSQATHVDVTEHENSHHDYIDYGHTDVNTINGF